MSVSREVVIVKNAKPIHFTDRSIERFLVGEKAWISFDGKKAIPVTIVAVDNQGYTFKYDVPQKKYKVTHLFLDEVRSTPELACANRMTS